MSRATKYQLRASLLVLGVGVVTVAATTLTGLLEIGDALALGGILTVANLALVLLLVRLWMRPLADLLRRVREVRKGEHIPTARWERDDEVGELARHYNGIVTAIQEARRESVEIGRKQASIEKFAALGRLSASVAHEINNPVGGILTCVDSLRRLEPGSERYEEYLALVRSGIERIGTIVKQLLSYSRQPETERREVDVNDIIREVAVLSAFHNRRNGVSVHQERGDVPPVHGYPALLNQLFLNLVLNALQAMPAGGTLRIYTEVRNGEVLASFEDSGPGIAEEDLDRIFEPFFTTKDVGEGTGLGLSVAHGIVDAHGGSIHAENYDGGGARFTVHLPAAGRASRGSEDKK